MEPLGLELGSQRFETVSQSAWLRLISVGLQEMRAYGVFGVVDACCSPT